MEIHERHKLGLTNKLQKHQFLFQHAVKSNSFAVKVMIVFTSTFHTTTQGAALRSEADLM